ncbi:hypothetical protein Tco_0521554, partial [Tanacetum coccineum]
APPSLDYIPGPEEPQSPRLPDFVTEMVYPEYMPQEDDDLAEEKHPLPADSTAAALPAADQAPSPEETDPFEIDESATTPPPHPAYRVT